MKYIKYLFITFLMFLTSNIFAQVDAPQNLQANTVKLEHESGTKLVVKLSWDKVKDAAGNDIPIYEVFKKDGSKSSAGDFNSLGERLWQNNRMDEDVIDGNTYTYYVIAKDGKGQKSAPSKKVEITVSSTIAGTESATISGNVTDEVTGSGLEGIYVTLFSTTTLVGKVVQTDVNGDYSVSLLPGDYIAYFKAPKDYFPEYYNDAARVTDATFLNVGENETLTGIDAALKPISSLKFYNVSGKVTDADGNPVLAAVNLMIMSKYNFPIKHRHARTDENGNYSIKVREGVEVIVFARPLHSDLYGEFYNDATTMADAERIMINGDVNNIDFVLDTKPQGTANVAGKVMNANSEVVQGMVMAINIDTPRMNRGGKLRAFTNDNGEYGFESLAAGRYIFFVIPEAGYLPSFYKADGTTTLKWKEADVVTLEDGDNFNDINFILETVPEEAANAYAEIRGTVLDENGAPVVDAYVYVYNSNNEIVSYSFTDNNGQYNVSGITPGIYSVGVNEFGLEEGENDNVVAGTDEPGTADFTLANSAEVTDVETKDIPNTFSLNQNYPNPFNPTTTISFAIAEKGKVQLKVYDIIGKEIKTLVNGELSAGVYNLTFDASNLPSGIYIYEIRTNKFLESRKMMLLK